MRYVVCYDIADDRRRDRVAAALLDYGRRVQESVFLAELEEAGLVERMRERLGRLVRAEEDTVHIFTVCEGCWKGVEVMGLGRVVADEDFYIL